MKSREQLKAELEAIDAKLADLAIDSVERGTKLVDRALLFGELASLRNQQRLDLEEAVACVEAARSILTPDDATFGDTWVIQGGWLKELAPLRGRQRVDLETAIESCENARKLSSLRSRNFGASWILHAECLRDLASVRSQQRIDLEESIKCYESARMVLSSKDPHVGFSWKRQAKCLEELVPLRSQRRQDLEEAISCYETARAVLLPNQTTASDIWLSVGNCLKELASLRGRRKLDLEEAISCYKTARAVLLPNQTTASVIWLSVGYCLKELASLRGRRQLDLEEAINCFRTARSFLSPRDPTFGGSWLFQGECLIHLAPLREQQRLDLEQAINCCENTRNSLYNDHPYFGNAWVIQGNSLLKLSRLRNQQLVDLEQAISCCESARCILASSDPNFYTSWSTQGDCLRDLASIRGQKKADLMEAIACYKATLTAQLLEEPVLLGENLGATWVRLGECLIDLAPMGDRQQLDLEEAIVCFETGRELLPPSHPNLCASRLRQGECLRMLAPLRGQKRLDLEGAITCFEEARQSPYIVSNHLPFLCQNEAVARQALAGITPDLDWQWVLAFVCWRTVATLTTDPKELTRAWENYSYCREQFQLPDAEKEMLLAALRILDQSASALEQARARLGDLRSRAHLFESHADYFSLGVELCLELAQRPGGLDEIQNFRNHAWDWANFGRQRNFIENLRHQNSPEISTIKVVPPLETTPDPRQLQTEYAQIKRELLTKLSSGIDVTELSEKLENLELQIGQFRSRQQSKTKNVTSPPAPPPSPVSRVVELPKLEKILSTARDCFSSKSDNQRLLLVDFMTLSSEQCVVFVAPLWCEQDPVVMRLPISWSELLHWRREWMLAIHRVRRTLQRRTRKRGDLRLRASSSSGEQQAAIADAEDRMKRALSEISRMFEPLFDRVFSEAWNPTELIFCPHFLLHTFPLHALVWQGKPLIDHFAIRYLPTPAAIPKLLTRQISATGTALLVGNPDGSLPGAQREVAAVGAQLEDSGMQTIVVTDQLSKKEIILEGISRSRVAHLATHATLSRKDFLESRIELGEESIALSEIMGIKLVDGALVYLGSCDSARMLPGRSDDMMALGQAFFLAGAGAVIGSQWLLHDGAAEVFAKLFYANWAKSGSSSISIGEAFRQAMLELKEIPRFREHFFWAPFVLMGGF